MKWIQRVLLKIESGHDSVHRQTDGQGETNISPFNFIEAGDIIRWISVSSIPEKIPSKHLIKSRYRQVSNIRHTLAGNKFVDHSDVVGASPVGAAPTTSSFST